VCLTYEDDGFNVNKEAKLRLAHLVCADPINNEGCEWIDITLPGFPDTSTNEICGETESFSVFAILEPLDDDGDDVVNAEDNCPATPNPDQGDLDGDGIGDACESDIDGDGLSDDEDRCPFVESSDNTDTDEDGLGDVCDSDMDGDEIDNVADNCPVTANPAQVDFDEDGLGNACDLDDDGDSINDSADDCAGTSLVDPIDVRGCSSNQRFERACPVAAPYRNHGEFVSCVANEGEAQVVDELITEVEKDIAVSTAARSAGKKK
jgi:hypothetical protein